MFPLCDKPFWKNGFFARLVLVSDSPDRRHLKMRNQEPVLVEDIQLVKMPDGESIPTLVWLNPVDDATANSLRYSLGESAIDSGDQLFPRIADGELRSFVVCTVPCVFDSANLIIESSLEVVDCVSEDGRNVRRHGIDRGNVNHIASALCIEFDGEFVLVRARKIEQAAVKVIDVMMGAIQFDPRISK